MFFASDNSGPVHPQIMDGDWRPATPAMRCPTAPIPIMDEVRARLRDLFEAPEAAVYLVATGTAANALALATLMQPWQTVFCSPVAHIHEDECNAPEFYTGGAKLTLVPGGDKMTADALRGGDRRARRRAACTARSAARCRSRRSPNAAASTRWTSCARSATVAHGYGLPVHLDGARFANALVALGCTPAEMTWKAGVDAVSFGGTKNGCDGGRGGDLLRPRPRLGVRAAAQARARISFPSTATSRHRCRATWRTTSGSPPRGRRTRRPRNWRRGCRRAARNSCTRSTPT